MRKIILIIAALGLLAGCVKVDESGDGKVPASMVTLNRDAIKVTVGDTELLIATVDPINSTDKVRWLSSDEGVATVEDGLVTGISAGNANITAIAGYRSAVCAVTVKKAFVFEAVDLGLSVKWANSNLGALSEEGYGDYYAWGETEPYCIKQSRLIWKEGKEAGYVWESYGMCEGSYNTLTKYNTSAEYGTVDGLAILEESDDAAHAVLGGGWRMPTYEEWLELNSCASEWIMLNGVVGKKFTSFKEGFTGNWIFLPATGGRTGVSVESAGAIGYYWSSLLNTDYPYTAWRFCIDSSKDGGVFPGRYSRCAGYPVRAVTE